MPYADASDVITRWGVNPAEVSAEDTALITSRISDAELLIRHKLPDLDQRITDGVLSADIVALVETNAVLRVVRNPEGRAQESDGNYSYMTGAESSGKLEITAEEWTLLGVRRRVFSIAPQSPQLIIRTPFGSGG